MMFEKEVVNCVEPKETSAEEAKRVISEIGEVPGKSKLAAALSYVYGLIPAGDDDRPIITFFSNQDAGHELWSLIGEVTLQHAPLEVIAAVIAIFARAVYYEGVKAGRSEQSEPQPETLQSTEAKA